MSTGVPNSIPGSSAIDAGAGATDASSRETPRNNSMSPRIGRNRGSRGRRNANSRVNCGRGRNSRHHQHGDHSHRHGVEDASQQGRADHNGPHRSQHNCCDNQGEQKPPAAARRREESKRGRGRHGGGGGGSRRGGLGRGHGRKAAGRAAATGEESDDADRPLCIVCTEELVYFAVGECNHPGRCAKCAMRSRMLLKDRSCPECKTLLERLVVAKLPPSGEAPRFESFNLWGNFAGPDADLDEESSMIFHSCAHHLDQLVRAREFRCPIGGCKGVTREEDIGRKMKGKGGQAFSTKEALLEHMKNVHRKFFCGVCLENRPLFVSEQEVFHGIAALKKHETGLKGGHPMCRFCSRRFYDNVALYDHMTRSHINCHLCPEEHQHRYFRGEPQLREHLRACHFLCDQPECRRRGVVSAFGTPRELQVHLAEEHGITSATDRRGAAAVGFSVRRTARDGTGLETHNGAAESDLVEEEGVVVVVPSSGGGESGAPPSSLERHGNPSGGWRGEDTSRSSPSTQEEAFPSLPTASSRPLRPAAQERHEFSLVGRLSRRGTDRAGVGAGAGAGPSASGGSSERARAGAGSKKEDEKRLLQRNKRLAEALGIQAALGAGAAIGGAKVGTTSEGAAVAMGIGDGLDAIREHLERTNYSTFLVSWARANRHELLKLERRLAELVTDRKATSTQLKPMPAVNRRAVHEMAVHYGLLTQSYDVEPKKYVSVIKQQGCRMPTRILSVSCRDPSYKGTDDVPPDATTTVVTEPPAPSSRAVALRSAVSTTTPSPPTLPRSGIPGVARVTSISSSANASASVSSKSKEAGESASGLTPPVQLKNNVQQQTSFEVGNSGISPQEHSDPKEASGAPHPENLLVFHSLKAGMSGEDVLKTVRKLVPARTVLGFRDATASEASALGLAGASSRSGGPVFVVEFSSGVNARRAEEKIEREAEQLIAAARATRAEFHPPFRTRPYPSSSSFVSPPQGSGNPSVGGGGGDALGFEDLDVRDNWDSSDDEFEGMGEAVTDAGADDGSLEVKEGSSELEGISSKPKGISSEHGEVSLGIKGSSSGLEEAQGSSELKESSADLKIVSSKLEEVVSLVVVPLSAATNVVPDEGGDMSAAATATAITAAVPTKRASKWGNSVIKGRLSRPSDGRVPTVEQESRERQERVEKLRRLEEARREARRQKSESEKRRAGHSDGSGKLDAHAFVWENLAESSSSEEETSEEEHQEGSSSTDDVPREQQASSSIGVARRARDPDSIEGRGDVSAASPAFASEAEANGGRAEVKTTTGWACERCTLWNEFGAIGGLMSCGGESLRCAVCETEAPRNAGLPWSTA